MDFEDHMVARVQFQRVTYRQAGRNTISMKDVSRVSR